MLSNQHSGPELVRRISFFSNIRRCVFPTSDALRFPASDTPFYQHQTHCIFPTPDALLFANIRRTAFCQHQTHCVLPTSDALRFANIRRTAFCHQMHCVLPSDALRFPNIRRIAFFQHQRHCVFSNIRGIAFFPPTSEALRFFQHQTQFLGQPSIVVGTAETAAVRQTVCPTAGVCLAPSVAACSADVSKPLFDTNHD